MASGPLREALQQSRTLIMGVVNTTPDSFSDGGRYMDRDRAVAHALTLAEEGADILDIGGESTRPGAEPVELTEELRRVIPVVEQLVKQTSIPISVDTSKPEVMQAAIEAGASMINDVRGLQLAGCLEVVAEAKIPVCIMHMQNQPATMQNQPEYTDVVSDVVEFLEQRIEQCNDGGIAKQDIIVDPGIGFGKTLQHNLQLLSAVATIKQRLGCELLIGVSRKSMIDALLGRAPDQRMAGSIGLAVQAALNGAKIVRVHDVAATYDAIRCAESVASI